MVPHVVQQILHLSLFLLQLKQRTILHRGDAGAVIPSVFKPLQTFDEDGESWPIAQKPYDTAHAGKYFVLEKKSRQITATPCQVRQ
jgi:hypothetical protein